MLRRRPERPPQLVEIVPPRLGDAPLAAAARMLAACALPAPFALELAGTAKGRCFYLRGATEARRHVEQQLLAAYPQATLRPLNTDQFFTLDPARLVDGEQVAVCGLRLAAPAHLPLRTFGEAARGDPGGEDDPLLGILAATAGLPPGWRAICQLVLRPAEPGWAAPYAHLALERPLADGRVAIGGPSWGGVAAMGGLAAALAAFPTVAGWYGAGDWLHLAMAGGGVGAALPLAVWLRRRLAPSPPDDPRLVREKLAHVAFRAQLRLAVFAPHGVARAEVLARLGRLAAAYGAFALPRGNALIPCALRLRGDELATVRALPTRGSRGLPFWPGESEALLNAQELAGLWHLPAGDADVPLLERTTARRWAPLPAAVARGCRIGAAATGDCDVPVYLPDDLLRRHLLLVAKTRRGKSGLLLRLAQHALAAQVTPRLALVLVDPHHDLARAALGLVPPDRRDDVVYLDFANRERPVGLNLLDPGLGWDAERAIGNALSVFRHQWDQYWGPRMEDIFRMVLLTLFTANAARCAADPDWRAEQYTILDVPLLLADPAFRNEVVAEGGDAVVAEWWRLFYDHLLDRRLQIESINPVLTKINRLAASPASRALLGQPCSTIAPADWLRSGQVIIVHTAQGVVGDDTAALLGGTVLNLLKLEVHAQAALPPARRRAVTVVVDEFHSAPGADYEAFLGELAKYGANLVLATQTLARLEAIDRAHERALRATLFANLDGLFAFHCSAEDARYLAPELGGALEVDDLVSLGEHRCYARLSAGRERLPVFSVALDPPPAGDAALADRLAAASAARYGRSRELVEAVRSALHARVDAAHRRAMEQAQRRKEEPPARPGVTHKAGKPATGAADGSPALTTPELPFGLIGAPDDAAPSPMAGKEADE